MPWPAVTAKPPIQSAFGRDEVGQAHVGARRRASRSAGAGNRAARSPLCAARPRTAPRRRPRAGTARRRPRPSRSATSRARCAPASCAHRRTACGRCRPPPCPRGSRDSCRKAPRRGRTASSRCARPARAADTRRRRAWRPRVGEHARLGRHVGRPVDLEGVGARLGERHQLLLAAGGALGADGLVLGRDLGGEVPGLRARFGDQRGADADRAAGVEHVHGGARCSAARS